MQANLPSAPEAEFLERVAVITGAGGGIGRAVAHRLAASGAIVIATDRRLRAAVETAESISSDGGRAVARELDVTDGSSFAAVVAEAMTDHGRIDVLVNNAGMVSVPTPIAEFSEESFDRLFAVNVKGVFLGLRHVLPVMIAQESGSVVNVASISAIRNVENLGVYAATKRAVVALTRAAATEVAHAGVRVNALLPGPTNTPMVAGRPGHPTGAEIAFAAQVPMGRVGAPEEQAEAVAFLASDRAGFISGSSLLVDGGLAYADLADQLP